MIQEIKDKERIKDAEKILQLKEDYVKAAKEYQEILNKHMELISKCMILLLEGENWDRATPADIMKTEGIGDLPTKYYIVDTKQEPQPTQQQARRR